MINILNNLEDFCENCPYMRLRLNEHLGSGLVGYSCVNLNSCIRVYKLNNKKGDEE